MKQLLKVVVILLTIGYPFMVYWGLQHYSAAKLLPLLLALLALRWLVGNRPGERPVLIAILAIVLTVAFTWGYQIGLKFYPALVNLGFLVLFAGSLLSPPSFVERLFILAQIPLHEGVPTSERGDSSAVPCRPFRREPLRDEFPELSLEEGEFSSSVRSVRTVENGYSRSSVANLQGAP